MFVSIQIESNSTAPELSAASRFLSDLATVRAAASPVQQTVAAQSNPPSVEPAAEPAVEAATAVSEQPKPVRRRKAEPVTEVVVEAAEVAAQVEAVAAQVEIEAADESDTSTKQFSAAEVQLLASDAARRVGPEKVKQLIASFAASRIAELTSEQLQDFAVKVQAL